MMPQERTTLKERDGMNGQLVTFLFYSLYLWLELH